jgi:hypothetical protein
VPVAEVKTLHMMPVLPRPRQPEPKCETALGTIMTHFPPNKE